MGNTHNLFRFCNCCVKHSEEDTIEFQKIYNSRYNDIVTLFKDCEIIEISLVNESKYMVYKILYNSITYYCILVKEQNFMFSVTGFKKLIKVIFADIINITPCNSSIPFNESFVQLYLRRRSVDDYFDNKKNYVTI